MIDPNKHLFNFDMESNVTFRKYALASDDDIKKHLLLRRLDLLKKEMKEIRKELKIILQKEYNKKAYASNPEYHKKRRKDWYEKNKEKAQKTMKEYYLKKKKDKDD